MNHTKDSRASLLYFEWNRRKRVTLQFTLFTVGDKSWIANNNNVITDDRVREIVKEVLKVYDADKTGRVDYALESAGKFAWN